MTRNKQNDDICTNPNSCKGILAGLGNENVDPCLNWSEETLTSNFPKPDRGSADPHYIPSIQEQFNQWQKGRYSTVEQRGNYPRKWVTKEGDFLTFVPAHKNAIKAMHTYSHAETGSAKPALNDVLKFNADKVQTLGHDQCALGYNTETKTCNRFTEGEALHTSESGINKRGIHTKIAEVAEITKKLKKIECAYKY